MTIRNLDALFRPHSIAVVGATNRRGSVGSVVMRNLLRAGFDGPIMPVHPKHESVGGVLAYPDVSALPATPDLAVVCTPPVAVPQVVADLGARGTRAAIVLTAGLAREHDAEGRTHEARTLAAARAHGLRILGPNCIGLLAPGIGLDASFAHIAARAGSIAFVSQSGALCTAVLDWADSSGIGFSCFVSLGDTLDVDFGDTIDWLGADANTTAILLYVESVRNARRFLSAARAASRNKPIVAIKSGRVAEGERAAASHTRALAGADDVVDYALRRAGILRVDEIEELFAAVETLAHTRPLRGSRLAIVTNGGGAGVMATDALVRGGGKLAQIDAATIAALDATLPPTWSRQNPIDIIGDAPGARFHAAVARALADHGVDALLVLHAPTAIADRIEAAQAVVTAARDTKKPVLACWLGGRSAEPARRVLADGGIATYDTPGSAVRAFLQMARHREGRELLMQTPASVAAEAQGGVGRARAIADAAVATGRGWLTDEEVHELLDAFGIATVATAQVGDAAAAARAAAALGLPVALKIRSPDVLHKSDLGGVVLDLDSPRAVADAAAAMLARIAAARPQARIDGFTVQRMARRPTAHELFVGAAVDPVFGPFVMFGRGGIAVEVIADRAVALPPLDSVLAREVIARTRVARLLAGYRGRAAADLDAVVDVLIRVSNLLTELPQVTELDLNPLLADEHGVLALDARIRVAAFAGSGAQRLAIRPYPHELEEHVRLASGLEVQVRAIRPEDEPSHRELFESFSPEDVRFRFFGAVREWPHSQLARYTQIDYDREMAFIALDPAGRELGVVRAIADPDGEIAEFAIIVRPSAKGQGLGRLLLEKMIRYCKGRGTKVLLGRVLRDNRRMLDLARGLGFEIVDREGDDDLEVRLQL